MEHLLRAAAEQPRTIPLNDQRHLLLCDDLLHGELAGRPRAAVRLPRRSPATGVCLLARSRISRLQERAPTYWFRLATGACSAAQAGSVTASPSGLRTMPFRSGADCPPARSYPPARSVRCCSWGPWRTAFGLWENRNPSRDGRLLGSDPRDTGDAAPQPRDELDRTPRTPGRSLLGSRLAPSGCCGLGSFSAVPPVSWRSAGIGGRTGRGRGRRRAGSRRPRSRAPGRWLGQRLPLDQADPDLGGPALLGGAACTGAWRQVRSPP